jgi:tRNA (mo5U34)-methyltransferase
VGTTLTAEELQRRLADVYHWYHSIDLGHGIVTPGRDDTRARLDHLRIPEDLRGSTVLDIGAWDGFFSFEAERRGASRVVAADKWAWSWPAGKRGFELAREALGSEVEDREIDVLELSPEAVGVFDLVLFLGVLYHMRHPLLALERVASVTGRQLILETGVDLSFTRRPAMAFYPKDELQGDETNWWGPNAPAVVEMLRAVGFNRVEVVTPNSLAYRSARGAYRIARALAGRGDGRPLAVAQQGRLVVHAFR